MVPTTSRHHPGVCARSQSRRRSDCLEGIGWLTAGHLPERAARLSAKGPHEPVRWSELLPQAPLKGGRARDVCGLLTLSSQGRKRRGASETTSERCRDTPKQIQGQVYKCGDLQTGKRRLCTWYLLGGYRELCLEPRDSSGASCHSLQSGLWLHPTVVRSAPHLGRCVHGGLKLTAYTEGGEEALFRGAESTSSAGRPRSQSLPGPCP